MNAFQKLVWLEAMFFFELILLEELRPLFDLLLSCSSLCFEFGKSEQRLVLSEFGRSDVLL